MIDTSHPAGPYALPTPKQVFEDPAAHWALLTAASDSGFEGQHFDRKEAGRAEADGSVHNARLKTVREQIEECISAFANASGGLLVLGIAASGMAPGLAHLSEEQLNSLLRFDRLLHHNCQMRLCDVPGPYDGPTRIALFLVPPASAAICETAQTPAKAWIRQGSQNIPLTDAARDRLRRDRRVVDFERMACTRFNIGELDPGILRDFKDSYLSIASYEWAHGRPR